MFLLYLIICNYYEFSLVDDGFSNFITFELLSLLSLIFDRLFSKLRENQYDGSFAVSITSSNIGVYDRRCAELQYWI